MATDYDSPRKTDDELTEDSLQELQARRLDKSSSTIDIDPDDVAESLELPGADLSNEELSFRVIPSAPPEPACRGPGGPGDLPGVCGLTLLRCSTHVVSGAAIRRADQ